MENEKEEFASSALEAINRFIAEQEKENPTFQVQMPRDFVPCRWCGGNGCGACYNARRKREKELEEEYNRQFPNGPEPILTARLDNPKEIELAKAAIGKEAIEKAFGPGGGGIEEVVKNCEKAMEEIKKQS